MLIRQYKKYNKLYSNLTKNKMLSIRLIYNIIDKFLTPESNYLLDNKVKID